MEDAANTRFVYEFGKFTLDPQEKTLFIEGRPLHLPAKEFETLRLLVENNGRALSKEDMISALWPEAFVEESNLSQKISHLRKIFKADGQNLIETLPKHGYRFSADVRQIFQPVVETILEKHTIKRVTVLVEDETTDSPLALQPKRRSPFQPIVWAILALTVLTSIVLAWFWQRSKPAVKPDESGIVFLTGGQFEDAGSQWTDQGQIYFSRYITKTRFETWTMNADGTNQRRANSEIKTLLHGNWSPDGKKVVFIKEGDHKTIYLADSNGANEIVLPIIGGNMDWSPDGSQFVHQARVAPDRSEIFLYTLATGKNIRLSEAGIYAADPSFSYDGRQIAFTSWRDGNAEIYVMNTDKSNLRRITNHPAGDNFPVFSPDGTSVAFQSNRENERIEIYLQNLNDESPPRKISNFNGTTGISPKCWSADGTEIIFWTDQNGKAQIVRAKVDPFPAQVVLSDETADLDSPRLAPDGKQILYQARLADHSIELRLTDLETKKTRMIFKTAPNYPLNYPLFPVWSPDRQRIAFNDRPDGNTEIFIINADGSGLQNLTRDPSSDTTPFFSPDGSEIIFVRDLYGSARLYRMNPDGGHQRRLTEREGFEMTPSFSPDGSQLAFAGDQMKTDSRGLDIFLLDFRNQSEEKRLTARRFHDILPTFSPDGKRIAFVSNSDGNAEIYLINTDGTGLFRLTRSQAAENSPEFSKDGKRLIFASNPTGKFALYAVNLE